jgi:hypothetical protein
MDAVAAVIEMVERWPVGLAIGPDGTAEFSAIREAVWRASANRRSAAIKSALACNVRSAGHRSVHASGSTRGRRVAATSSAVTSSK